LSIKLFTILATLTALVLFIFKQLTKLVLFTFKLLTELVFFTAFTTFKVNILKFFFKTSKVLLN
jgi:hypothetical protein